jgi:DNA invertase Pin-like site-specific DNA recombinase
VQGESQLPSERPVTASSSRKGGSAQARFTDDAGESARSADRPALQEMLTAVQDDPTIKFVVVHKVDRIARNLEDHAGIRAALSKSGARLVSASEGIDDTASGRMVEGILASIAEYYSANLSNEIKKGMHQKVKMGGWPWPAPIGYLNKRESIQGRSVATVIVDPSELRSSRRASSATPPARSPSTGLRRLWRRRDCTPLAGARSSPALAGSRSSTTRSTSAGSSTRARSTTALTSRSSGLSSWRMSRQW